MAKNWREISYVTDELTRLQVALGNFYAGVYGYDYSYTSSLITFIPATSKLYFAYDTAHTTQLNLDLATQLLTSTNFTSMPSALTNADDSNSEIFRPNTVTPTGHVTLIRTDKLGLNYWVQTRNGNKVVPV